jgi:predicted nucleic acid-binding protein
MRRFFDTNILIYAYGRTDVLKRDLARACMEEAIAADEFTLSIQVLAEFYRTAVRLNIMGASQAQALVRLWSEHDVVHQTPDLLARSISLHQEHSLAFWDAMIVQAAIDARCGVLLSEDLQHGRRFGDLEIVNPFIAGAAHEGRAVRYGKSRAGSRRMRATTA